SKAPHIDVFSTAFDIGYMKSASSSGYQGIYPGMTRKEDEDKDGKSDGNVDSSNYTYEKYGNLAVAYENDEVVHVGVAPNDISEDQFIQKYNEPDDRKPNQLIYDSNKDNDFSVLVNVKNGKISVIE
ncbi:zinc ribbon domain-containing protein, partial [Staphylococcus caprae]